MVNLLFICVETGADDAASVGFTLQAQIECEKWKGVQKFF
jgi:hypothetical protein